MKRKLIAACFSLVLLAGLCPRATAKTPPPTPEELIEAAHKVSGLDALAPYTFAADVALAGDSRRGTLVISRDGDKERVELKIGDYLEKQVSLGTTSYVEPKHAFLAAVGFAGFDRSWDPKPPTFVAANAERSFGKVSSKKIHGQSAWCFDEHSKYLKTTLCFDSERSIMLEKGRKKNLYEFLDFFQVGNQLVPQTVKITHEWLPDITLNNIRLSRGPLAPELWVPAQDSLEIQHCDQDSKPPKAEFTPEPSFSPKARAAHKTGMVTLYAIITSKGQLVMAQSLNHDPFGFADQAEQIVKIWRFKPGTCGGVPINVQMTLQIDFNYAP